MKFTFRYNKIDYVNEEKLGTLLTLANGRFSIRGELELIPSRYGIFVSHIYDYTPIFYREIVNMPRPIGLYIVVDKKPLLRSNGYSITRILDVYNGVLKTIVGKKDEEKVVTYESTRFVHKKRKMLAGLRARIRVPRNTEELIIISPIELDKTNPSSPENILVKHYRVVDKLDRGYGIGVVVETIDKKYRVGIASSTVVESASNYERTIVDLGNVYGEMLRIDVSGSDDIVLVKWISVVRSLDTNNIVDKMFNVIKEASLDGWDKVFNEHTSSWNRLWDEINLSIEGDREAESLLKFSAFHLLQLVDEDSNYLIIPARGLHGIGYRGHVFWDTDLYTLPFYSLVEGSSGRKILMYRCVFLKEAMKYARSLGYDGAKYPWECSDDGIEATPDAIPLDIHGLKKIEIYTGREEEHVTADIAYAIEYYYNVSRDTEFMVKCGLRVLFETARYWASRVVYENGFYRIKNVMGPDEYHSHVNDNFYTNIMVKKNLELAIKYYEKALTRSEWRKVVEEANITREEVIKWIDIARKMYIPCRDDGLCEEFDGYLDLEDQIVPDNCIGERCVPENVLKKIDKTRLIKQADVVAALFLLYNEFHKDVVEKNFDYYIKRTTHSSSLSLPMYAGLAARLGLTDLAYKLFIMAAKTDLEDPYNNEEYGFHIGAAGGVWYAFLHGFLGINIVDGEIRSIEPALPRHWRKVTLNIVVGGRRRRIVVVNSK